MDLNKFFSEFEEMFEEVGNMFTSTYSLSSTKKNYRTYSQDGSVFVTNDLPGYGKDDVAIILQNGIIVLEGKITDREFRYKFSLPKGADIENITAKCDKGILTLEIPLKEEEQAIKIKIE